MCCKGEELAVEVERVAAGGRREPVASAAERNREPADDDRAVAAVAGGRHGPDEAGTGRQGDREPPSELSGGRSDATGS